MRELFWKVRDWLERASDWTVASVRKILPNADDSSETRNLKVTVFLFVGIIGLMLVIGLVTFSIAVRGQDETLVPNLEGKDVLDALSISRARSSTRTSRSNTPRATTGTS